MNNHVILGQPSVILSDSEESPHSTFQSSSRWLAVENLAPILNTLRPSSYLLGVKYSLREYMNPRSTSLLG